MAAREAYVRAVVPYGGGEAIAGLEFRPDDDFKSLLASVSVVVADAAGWSVVSADRLAFDIAERLKARWPDRAYFIEVTSGDEGWIQLFQPYGIPKGVL